MKIPDNIQEIITLNPDYLGFIFYNKSPRFAGNLNPEITKHIPDNICKVGVFVNEPQEKILKITREFDISTVQLHGSESPDTCKDLQNRGLTVIKAISIAEPSDLQSAANYQSCCNYLLFDTKTVLHGGSGLQYDWSILKNYNGKLPFFLSGGIGPEDAERIISFHHPKLQAIDINSRFEIAPGIKNKETLQLFLNKIRTNI